MPREIELGSMSEESPRELAAALLQMEPFERFFCVLTVVFLFLHWFYHDAPAAPHWSVVVVFFAWPVCAALLVVLRISNKLEAIIKAKLEKRRQKLEHETAATVAIPSL